MLPRLNDPDLALGNMRRFHQVCVQALTWSGVVFAALLAWPPLHLEWLALLVLATLSFWAAGTYRWLAPAAVIACACVGTFYGAALLDHGIDLLRLLGLSLAAVVVANLSQRLGHRSTQEQEQLAERTTCLEMLANLRPALAWSLLPDRRPEFANQAVLDYTGARAAASLNDCLLASIHPDDVRHYLFQLGQTVTGESSEMEMRLRRHDGQYRWMLCRIHPMRDRRGILLRWVSISQDIEDSKRAESTLRKQEEAYRHMVDFVPACICVADAQGDIIYANKVAVAALGKPVEQIIGKGWLDSLHPHSLPVAQREWSVSIKTRRPLDAILLFKQNDGEYRWQHMTAVPWLDENGNVTCWYMLGVEIHELIKAQEALKTSEQELTKIIETLPLGIWCTSPEGEATYINQRLRDYCGATPELSKDWQWAQFMHPDDRDAVVAAFMHAVGTGASYSSTHRLRGLDGSYRWYEQRAEAFRDANGQIRRWYGIAVDIDERVRMEERLHETRVNLARASHVATVAELSASIAHELNQPLTSVIANAQAGRRWLAAIPPNVTEAARSIDMILRDGRAADETMQNIRALFKRQSVKKSRTRVEEMVREAVRLVLEDSQRDPQRKKMPIECLFAQRLPTVLADRIQIQQILMNLICNGIEAAEHIGRPPCLRIGVQPYLEDRLLIEVRDNGPGVTDPVGIFDAFVTTKSTGMGIGLAISRSIAQAHGGQLWAENLADGGACFKLVLPTA
jgi:PAS domain S-box-containing protein